MFTITPSTLPFHLLQVEGDIATVNAGDSIDINGTAFPVRGKLFAIVNGALVASVLVAKSAVREEVSETISEQMEVLRETDVTGELEEMKLRDQMSALVEQVEPAVAALLVSKYGFVDNTPAESEG